MYILGRPRVAVVGLLVVVWSLLPSSAAVKRRAAGTAARASMHSVDDQSVYMSTGASGGAAAGLPPVDAVAVARRLHAATLNRMNPISFFKTSYLSLQAKPRQKAPFLKVSFFWLGGRKS